MLVCLGRGNLGFGLLSLTAMWCLWQERNLRTFEGSETSSADLQLIFFRTLFEWLLATNMFSFVPFQDFIDSCNT